MPIVEEYTESSINGNKIPKRIILTYKTKSVDTFPNFYKRCLDKMLYFFNDYEVKIFDDDEMERLVIQFDKNLYEIYKDKKIIEKTDIFRLVALYTYGGIYMDLDVLLTKSPREYISSCDKDVILCAEKNQSCQPYEIFLNSKLKYVMFSNYFIASIVKAKFIYECILYILIINSTAKK